MCIIIVQQAILILRGHAPYGDGAGGGGGGGGGEPYGTWSWGSLFRGPYSNTSI